MEKTTARRAVAAAISVAVEFDMVPDDAVVLSNSNRLVVRLVPCDVVARVSPQGWFSAAREVEIARHLADEAEVTIAGLHPSFEPIIHVCDGFDISMWRYFDAPDSSELQPADYAVSLERLHRSLRNVSMSAPPFTDRLAEIQRWLAAGDATPDLDAADRDLLIRLLDTPHRVLAGGAAAEQLLHGEPHPWNVLDTEEGSLFIDFENCARGPVEFDLAWVPDEVSTLYRGANQDLVASCRAAVLALVAAHRWRHDDQHPSGRESGVAFLDLLRSGPPWPALDAVRW